jgi:Dolichyl-phosphate-mannose-protein mannosyltransferase
VVLNRWEKVFLISFFGLALTKVFGWIDFVGPFIFGDESYYFELLRTFRETGLVKSIQYGVLYPMFAGLFYSDSNVIGSYESIRFINGIVFCSSILPWYLFNRIHFQKKWFAMVLAFIFVLMPWGALSGMIWAEPLFFCIYSWCWYLFYRNVHKSSPKSLFALGVLTGLLYLTKQSGAVALAGFVVGYIALCILQRREIFRIIRELIYLIAPFATIFACSAIYNRLVVNTSALAYGNVAQNMFSSVHKIFFQQDFWVSLGHQVSYSIFATLLVFMVVVFYLAIPQKKIPAEKTSLAIAAVGIFLGLCVLIARFNTTMGESYNAPNEVYLATGRYLCVVFPVFISLGISGLSHLKRWIPTRSFKFMFVVAALIMALFPPFRSAYSHGVINSQDAAWLTNLFVPSKVPILSKEFAEFMTSEGRIYLALAWLLLGWILFLLARSERRILVSLILFGYFHQATYGAMEYVNVLGGWTWGQNGIIKFAVKQKYEPENLRFAKPGFSPFILQFWLDIEDVFNWLDRHTVDIYEIHSTNEKNLVLITDFDLKSSEWSLLHKENNYRLYKSTDELTKDEKKMAETFQRL